ncbi:hypothetical protein CPB83DRAFT_840934 [Crepidotus variabilis]|uniref:Uncharacterized protein n=1 Tax=Crepidotus variabilis TaxID=179855 RepID=A0A9P6JI79_9AGAR|nr:hypothetical protein CPB83DRAFT_840934 [Crepidotus variabilis]
MAAQARRRGVRQRKTQHQAPTPEEEWVRESINILLGIKSTSELLTHNDIFHKDTSLQQHIKNFNARLHRSPAIKPMKVYWESIHSVWNEVLFEEFKKLSIDKGKMLELDEEQELYDMILQFKLYLARLDTILDCIPHPEDIDSEDEGLDNKTKVWLDAHKVVDALGIEGRWLRKVDNYRSGLAAGGARQPGTALQDRRRQNTPSLSLRKPLSGLPKNLLECKAAPGAVNVDGEPLTDGEDCKYIDTIVFWETQTKTSMKLVSRETHGN